MRKSHQSFLNDKTAFRIYKRKILQTSAVRTGVCAYMDATLLPRSAGIWDKSLSVGKY